MANERTARDVSERFAGEQEDLERYVEFLNSKSSIYD
jgi:hypothetical protein